MCLNLFFFVKWDTSWIRNFADSIAPSFYITWVYPTTLTNFPCFVLGCSSEEPWQSILLGRLPGVVLLKCLNVLYRRICSRTLILEEGVVGMFSMHWHNLICFSTIYYYFFFVSDFSASKSL
jgi:hypothetical protein